MGGWLGSDLLGAPRVLFAFARDGFLPKALGRVSPRTAVPATAIVTHAIIAALLAVTGTFETLVVLSVLSACALYIGGCAAAWILRRRGVALVGAPLRLPWLGLWTVLGCGSMLVVILLAQWDEIGGLVAAIAGSCVLYWVARRLR
jgi:APA family basic amino acid/polyamine antiporter